MANFNAWLPQPTATEYVQNVVTDGIISSQSKSEQAVAMVNDIVGSMSAMMSDISNVPSINASLGSVSSHVTGFTSPGAPERPEIDTSVPAAPPMQSMTGNFPAADAMLGIGPIFASVSV